MDESQWMNHNWVNMPIDQYLGQYFFLLFKNNNLIVILPKWQIFSWEK
jgi:hypothetical protein